MIKKKGFELDINVHPLSKNNKIEFKNNILNIYIKEKPDKNKANKAVIKALKKIFKADINIISGLKSKKKKIIICDKEKQDVENILKNSFFLKNKK